MKEPLNCCGFALHQLESCYRTHFSECGRLFASQIQEDKQPFAPIRARLQDV
jgi:hypothetical protein